MNKGFTLVELLVVIAISIFLIGMALVGTQGTQAQVTLNAAAASFISNVNLMKNDAIAGDVSLGSDYVSPSTNWVYGFSIFPEALSSTPSSNPELCQSTVSNECAAGYYTAIIEENVQSASYGYGNYSPPFNNSLNSVYNLNDYAYPESLINHNIYIRKIFSLTQTQVSYNRNAYNWVYYNSLPAGVSISYPNTVVSNEYYFPVFQELTGYIYLYNLNTGNLVTSSSNTSLSVVFNLSYEGYTIPITFYDLYNSSNESNSFSEGIITNG